MKTTTKNTAWELVAAEAAKYDASRNQYVASDLDIDRDYLTGHGYTEGSPFLWILREGGTHTLRHASIDGATPNNRFATGEAYLKIAIGERFSGVIVVCTFADGVWTARKIPPAIPVEYDKRECLPKAFASDLARFIRHTLGYHNT